MGSSYDMLDYGKTENIVPCLVIVDRSRAVVDSALGAMVFGGVSTAVGAEMVFKYMYMYIFICN